MVKKHIILSFLAFFSLIFQINAMQIEQKLTQSFSQLNQNISILSLYIENINANLNNLSIDELEKLIKQYDTDLTSFMVMAGSIFFSDCKNNRLTQDEQKNLENEFELIRGLYQSLKDKISNLNLEILSKKIIYLANEIESNIKKFLLKLDNFNDNWKKLKISQLDNSNIEMQEDLISIRTSIDNLNNLINQIKGKNKSNIDLQNMYKAFEARYESLEKKVSEIQINICKVAEINGQDIKASTGNNNRQNAKLKNTGPVDAAQKSDKSQPRNKGKEKIKEDNNVKPDARKQQSKPSNSEQGSATATKYPTSKKLVKGRTTQPTTTVGDKTRRPLPPVPTDAKPTKPAIQIAPAPKSQPVKRTMQKPNTQTSKPASTRPATKVDTAIIPPVPTSTTQTLTIDNQDTSEDAQLKKNIRQKKAQLRNIGNSTTKTTESPLENDSKNQTEHTNLLQAAFDAVKKRQISSEENKETDNDSNIWSDDATQTDDDIRLDENNQNQNTTVPQRNSDHKPLTSVQQQDQISSKTSNGTVKNQEKELTEEQNQLQDMLRKRLQKIRKSVGK